MYVIQCIQPKHCMRGAQGALIFAQGQCSLKPRGPRRGSGLSPFVMAALLSDHMYPRTSYKQLTGLCTHPLLSYRRGGDEPCKTKAAHFISTSQPDRQKEEGCRTWSRTFLTPYSRCELKNMESIAQRTSYLTCTEYGVRSTCRTDTLAR